MFDIILSCKSYPFIHNLVKKMIDISKKFLIKIPVEIKRTICYKCYRVQILNVNVSSRINKCGGDYFVSYECFCGNLKKYKLHNN